MNCFISYPWKLWGVLVCELFAAVLFLVTCFFPLVCLLSGDCCSSLCMGFEPMCSHFQHGTLRLLIWNQRAEGFSFSYLSQSDSSLTEQQHSVKTWLLSLPSHNSRNFSFLCRDPNCHMRVEQTINVTPNYIHNIMVNRQDQGTVHVQYFFRAEK